MNRTREDFCINLLDDALERGLDPEGVAARFVRYFNVSGHLTVPELTVLLRETGFGTVTGKCRESLDVKGIHFSSPGGGYDIHYRDDLWEGSKEHTVLHETYEIIDETLCDLYSGSAPVRRVCRQADRFAAAALMPPNRAPLNEPVAIPPVTNPNWKAFTQDCITQACTTGMANSAIPKNGAKSPNSLFRPLNSFLKIYPLGSVAFRGLFST